MNAQISFASHTGPTLINDEIWQTVQHIVASPAFAKAPRMCHLLSFLMEKKLTGMEHLISEYGIGLEVFKRDARDYDTAIDPVVRVQMGRLRSRLAQYYAAFAAAPAVQIMIPLGSYIPVMATAMPVERVTYHGKLQLAPLRNLAQDSGASAFVCGVEEELSTQLFQMFGSALEYPAMGGGWPPNVSDLRLAHRLEISIRVENRHARVSIRLLNANMGEIALLSQCDRYGEQGIGLQEQLAQAICAELKRYFTPVSASFDAERAVQSGHGKTTGIVTFPRAAGG
jgi:TolB-like protein